ncbi:MAG: helix-turn-helix transcriptional regulator [Deltaproteobacteria bacterium]|nr:helix-turn-helix transcriptional regulator [Deltaproteobacteria bacterium]
MTDKKKDSTYGEFLNAYDEYSEPQKVRDFLDDISAYAKQKSEPERAERVGERVKQVREQKGLTLEDLASRTGYTTELLKEIEEELVSPPLGVLIKLSKALDMKMGYLITGGESKPYTILRKHERRPVSRYASKKGKRYGYAYESLAPGKKDRHMEPFLVTLEPADVEEERSTHDGQEFIFVMDGAMEVLLGDERHVLYPGDCIYYDSTVPHLVRCHQSEVTRILAVLYAPSH